MYEQWIYCFSGHEGLASRVSGEVIERKYVSANRRLTRAAAITREVPRLTPTCGGTGRISSGRAACRTRRKGGKVGGNELHLLISNAPPSMKHIQLLWGCRFLPISPNKRTRGEQGLQRKIDRGCIGDDSGQRSLEIGVSFSLPLFRRRRRDKGREIQVN